MWVLLCIASVAAASDLGFVLPPGYKEVDLARGLQRPRQLCIDPGDDTLVVMEAGTSSVTKLLKNGGKVVLVTAPGLTHSVAIHEDFLYASSATTVFRWPYKPGTVTRITAPAVIVGIPGGGHVTRTLLFTNEYLFVSIGSSGNVDATSARARVMRYSRTQLQSPGFNWSAGTLFADGLRNECALTLDPEGKIWGVENGVDNLERADLGGDIHQNNPGEELNLLGAPDRETSLFFGYPDCWSEGPGADFVGQLGPTTQWFEARVPSPKSDSWCRNTVNVVAPAFVLPAHVAPLGAAFNAHDQAFGFHGDLFVAAHGSWNRQPAQVIWSHPKQTKLSVFKGYAVYRVHFDQGLPVNATVFLGTGNSSPSRPVHPIFYQGNLCVSDDGQGRVVCVVKDNLN